MSRLSCNHDQRRQLVRGKKNWNGLDFVEVSDDQLVLRVYFLGKAPAQISAGNVLIQGGRRITDIQVTGIEVEREQDEDVDDYMQVFVDKYGDFSTYQLLLVELDPETNRPLYDGEGARRKPRTLVGFDPRYSQLEFSFKVGCPSDLDCLPPPACTPAAGPAPDINYLAKDYSSFRQLILDRLALTMPNWKERHVPDLGITLVELLAYVGDHLSYYQDAVGTEAYLDTARRRVSVRRHARLVDYHLHEGCNARAWVTLEVDTDYKKLLPDDFYLITTLNNQTTLLTPEQLPRPSRHLVFEPLVRDRKAEIPLYATHNAIRFYTWGDSRCCLPKGATSATLLDPGTASPPDREDGDCHTDDPRLSHPELSHSEQSYTENRQVRAPQVQKPKDSDYQLHLKPCDILILEEIKGPTTGHPGDADPRHRQAVRLIHATREQDPLTGHLLWEIEWAEEDALDFPLCISAINREDCTPIEDISLVRGNVILVDQGETKGEDLPPVPGIEQAPDCDDHCLPRQPGRLTGRFRPVLGRGDLSFSQPLPACSIRHCGHRHITPARGLLQQDPRLALPVISLREAGQVDPINDWHPKTDLLTSDNDDRHFVVEVEEDRRAQLRFGDGDCGRDPLPDTRFTASYRVGNGNRGNVGAEAISHIVFKNNLPAGVGFVRVRNPIASSGGIDPEPLSEARLYAPHAFKKVLQRAITPADYVAIVERDFAGRVQRAAARLRWTGSWYEVLVAVDPLDGKADEHLLSEIHCHLLRYRRIAHDLVVARANYVPVDFALGVCIQPNYLRGQIRAALLDAFSDRRLAGGTTGFFHADNLSFGDGIQLSELVARAQAIEGVTAVQVLRLARQFEGLPNDKDPNGALEGGILPLGPFEIAILRQDPNYPEQGKFTLDLRGGR